MASRKARPPEDEPKKEAPNPHQKAPPVAPLDAAGFRDALRKLKNVDEDDFYVHEDALSFASDVTEWIRSGSIAIDRLLGGGYPMGRIVEVAAWESVGKSTLLDQGIASAQAQGDTCVLIDSEPGRDSSYTTRLGVDPAKLIISRVETIEAAFHAIDQCLSIQEAQIAMLAKAAAELRKRKREEEAAALRQPRLFIVWDSLGGTPTNAEAEGAADDSHVAEAAKLVKLNMRRIANRIANNRACLVFANQFYENIGPGFGPGLKSYGGSGVRYFASVRLWLSRIASLKAGEAVVGHVVEAKLKKTKVSLPKPPAQLGLIYGAGIHNAWTLWEWGKTHGIAPGHTWTAQRGSWGYLMFPDRTYESWQGTFLPFAEVLEKHPAVYAQMVDAYMAEQAVGGDE